MGRQTFVGIFENIQSQKRKFPIRNQNTHYFDKTNGNNIVYLNSICPNIIAQRTAEYS